MKKLMIAASAIVCAVMANASTVKWAMDSVEAYGSDETAENYKFYAFVLSTTADGDDGSTWTSMANVTAWAKSNGKTTTGVNSLKTAKLNDEGTKTSSAYNGMDATWNDPGVGQFYTVVFNSDNIDTATAYMISTVEALEFTEDGDQLTVTVGNNSWQAIDVPEPTSGLLLLLGVAGLALKRKRA